MATVTGYTAARMLEIENTTVVSGEIDGSGDLILLQRDSTPINAGNVIGPPGPPGEPGIDTFYPLGAIVPWPGAAAPSWGLFLQGQTIVGGATTYSAIAALFPSWVSGADLVLPDWRGRVPVGKTSSGTFVTLGSLVGAETHSHTLSDAGQAAIMVTTDMVRMRRITGASSYTPTHKVTASGFNTETTATSLGAGLRGETDAASAVQPSVVVNWLVCVASSSGEFDTEVQAALVSRVTALEVVNSTVKPAFQAVNAADQTRSGAAASVKINFATEELDMANNYDHTLSRFTAPVDGVYSISGVFAVTTTTTGPEIELFKNGTIFYNNVAIGYSTAYMSFGFSLLLDLNAGDYIELYLTNNNGVTTTLSGGRCRFSGHLVS